ncbi:MAG: thiamine pyrophosphate-requiring protein [Pseudorhizobium sp.]
MERERQATMTAGGAILARLKALGVDYIFANSGTDFPPIIEGLAEAAVKKIALPEAIVIPHEHAAMGMAHGYYLATGRSQAVMAHTNVGLANCAIGAINAATEQIPVLLFSGRTPVTEKLMLGSRTVPIGWGQEMRDQAALVREAVKWDYELRFAEQATDVVDRAHAIANSTPRGPVYVSLPREVLCQPCDEDQVRQRVRVNPASSGPREEDLQTVAALLAQAKSPLIVAQRGAGSRAGFDTLSRFAHDWAIPVCQYWAVQLAVPTEHPMAVGVDPASWLQQADLVLVLDCLAPWSPQIHSLPEDCHVVQIGADPLYERFPIRGFPADTTLVGETATIIRQLSLAADPYLETTASNRETRREEVRVAAQTRRKTVRHEAELGAGEHMTKAFVSATLADAVKGRKSTILSELGVPLEPLSAAAHDAWYQEPHSGGLGWSFPTALGMKLADRDNLVIATMGDGSYMFSNPVACHQVAEALELPLLILNNSEWGAVRQSVLGVYPDGYAAKSNAMPLVSLKPSPDYTKVAQASRAWTATVERGEELPAILAAAIEQVMVHKTLALVDIRVAA